MKLNLKYKNVDIKSDSEKLVQNTKVDAMCQQCGTWGEGKRIGVIDATLARHGIYVCKSCSIKNSSAKATKKRKETCLKRYGVDSPLKSKTVKDAYKKRCLEKYGVDSTNKLNSTNLKRKETCLKKYGVSNVFLTPENQEKMRITNKDNYKKVMNSIKLKYGVDNISQIPGVKAKALANNPFVKVVLYKNNCKTYDEFCDKVMTYLIETKNAPSSKETLQNFNCSKDYILRVLVVKNRLDLKQKPRDRLLAKNNCKTHEEFCQKIIKYLEDTKLFAGTPIVAKTFKCSEKTISEILHSNNRFDLISKDSSTSGQEIELATFLEKHTNYRILRNDRNLISPKEVDILIPNLKIAIEFNGLKWHSEQCLSHKNYHYNKYKSCLDQGYKLYTIFEHEWENHKPQIKQFLLKLITPSQKIFARKCTLTQDVNLIKSFIKENHIQGLAVSNLHLRGLLYNGEIVAALSVGQHHRKTKANLVLNRVCFSKYTIVGGLSKMLKSLPPMELLTWSDNRFSPVGNMYINAGFTLVAEYKPDYFYTHNGKAFSKQSQQKSHTGCPKEITESQWAVEHKFYKVWDCGKKCWKLTIK